MIRVALPPPLRTLARLDTGASGVPGVPGAPDPGEVRLEVGEPVTPAAIVDALEARYPALRGTIRDAQTGQRRPFLRFFACEEDLSLQPLDAPVPEAVAAGREPFLIVGAIAGG